ncbi:hypothetical protein BOTBODRAFT_104023 [Botryobasidium botryosum FD-172 SS1]|uniref:G domain-containing protein n=1 Tax=Botryobasidium botryosum (strain FD-172 SS1) TaxID=930990 RepID=A0A067MSV9_BOTB1|nr:hypothetical protein BOTBODRAFT_104023 [Botryobasidium botryosum FD-172 SS1]
MAEIRRPDQFRILIIGRPNAGKTTILRAVCGAEGEPDVYDQVGNKLVRRSEHNIEHSLMFPSSPGFVFHDSRGFESAHELELIRKFIQERAHLGSMKNQLHAIWYCFSVDNDMFITGVDKYFFDTIDTGSVPVIAIFTKFDILDSAAFNTLSAGGVPFKEAQKMAPERTQARFNHNFLPLLQKVAHPPRAVVCLRSEAQF